MTEKGKYTLTSLKDKKVEYPPYLTTEKEIHVSDIISIYYYLLYPKYVYEGEFHNYYELFVCLNGKALVTIDDEDFILNEKEFILSRPNSVHKHNPHNTFLSSVSINFSATNIPDNLICSKIGKFNNESNNVLNLLINEYINNFEVQKEYTAPYIKNIELHNEFAYKQILKNSLETLLILIIRSFKNEKVTQKVDILKEQKENENKIVQYIKMHYKEKLSLVEIAKQFNYSTGHLCRKFKLETGDTINDYITKLRISVAMRLLYEKQDFNIEEIALEVGFSDVQYFTKSFKKCVGTTPGKYRSETKETSAIHAQNIIFDVIKNI